MGRLWDVVGRGWNQHWVGCGQGWDVNGVEWGGKGT